MRRTWGLDLGLCLDSASSQPCDCGRVLQLRVLTCTGDSDVPEMVGVGSSNVGSVAVL